MRSRELDQVDTIALNVKHDLTLLKKHVEQNGPSTYSQIALIGLIDSLTDSIRQMCFIGDRSESTHR